MFAVLPSFLKRSCYRWFFGYKVGKRVRIGLSIIDARQCSLADDVSIGHLNVVTRVEKLTIGDHARIGHLNIIRGGAEVSLGRYSEIIRLNEINSIPDPEVVNEIDPRFILGDGSIVTTGHKIDFTDRVEIGRRVILGGRNSSLWTHNRQRTLPITIGANVYIGSEIRMAPGSAIPARSIVGIGSVITAPLAVYLSIRYWSRPLSIVPRWRWRFVVAIMVALAQIGVWVALGIFFFGAQRRVRG